MKRIAGIMTLLFLLTAACRAVSPTAPSTDVPPPTPTPAPTSTHTPQPASTALPDLMVDGYAVRYYGCPWTDGGEVGGRVRNEGSGRAGPFEVEINGSMTNVDGLEPGGEALPLATFEKGPVGSIYIEADPQNLLAESDESNNLYHIIFTPPPPCPTPGVEGG